MATPNDKRLRLAAVLLLTAAISFVVGMRSGLNYEDDCTEEQAIIYNCGVLDPETGEVECKIK